MSSGEALDMKPPPNQSTAGAVPVRNEEGEFSTEKVKRYTSGNNPDYAPQRSPSSDEEKSSSSHEEESASSSEEEESSSTDAEEDSSSDEEEGDFQVEKKGKKMKQDVEQEEEEGCDTHLKRFLSWISEDVEQRLARYRQMAESEVVSESSKEPDKSTLQPKREQNSDDEEEKEKEEDDEETKMRRAMNCQQAEEMEVEEGKSESEHEESPKNKDEAKLQPNTEEEEKLGQQTSDLTGDEKSVTEMLSLSEVKMGRGSPLGERLREQIVQQFKNNIPQRKIAKNLGISPSTVHNIIKRFRECGHISVRKKQGRKPILDGRDILALRQHCIENKLDSVVEVTAWAQKQFGKTMSVNTVRRCIHKC